MGKFVGDALKTADLPGAMARHDVGWGDYVYARRNDPAFDLACQEVDLVVRHALVIQLEARAAGGDQKAVKLLASGLSVIRAALEGQGADRDRVERRPVRADGPGPCRDCSEGLTIECPHCHRYLVAQHQESPRLAVHIDKTHPDGRSSRWSVRSGISQRSHDMARAAFEAQVKISNGSTGKADDDVVQDPWPLPPPNELPPGIEPPIEERADWALESDLKGGTIWKRKAKPNG